MLMVIRNIILGVGWPLLIAGSVIVFTTGKDVYQHVAAGLIGKVTKTFVVSMIVGMYSLGIVATVLMFADVKYTWLIIPVFGVWFWSFVKSLLAIRSAKQEIDDMTKNTSI